MRFKFDTVIAGAGEAMTRVLEQFGSRKLGGKVLVLCGGKNWMSSFSPSHQLGQSRQGLLLNPKRFENTRQLATVDEFRRELVDRQTAAVDQFETGKLEAFDTMLKKITRLAPRNLRLDCVDGTEVACSRLILCTGVGPERTMAGAGVRMLRTPLGPRAIMGEVSTPLEAMEKGGQMYKGKNVVVYGGGATGAWFIDWLLSAGVKSLLWIGRDFDGANPNGRNNEVMLATEGKRICATVESLEYLGSQDQAPAGGGLRLQATLSGGGTVTYEADCAVAAIGADPLAVTGVRSVLGDVLYKELSPVFGINRGFVARTNCNSVLVTSTPLSTDSSIWTLDGKNGIKWRELLETSFGNLNPENHVLAGLALTRLSAEAAVDIFAATEKQTT